MKPEDWIIAAIAAAGVFAFVVRLAHKATGDDRTGYVPTGFTWSHRFGGYSKVGADGMTYMHYV